MGSRRIYRSFGWLVVLGLTVAFATLARAGSRAVPGRIAYIALTKGTWQVWVASPDGSEARIVTRSVGDKIACSWYPDGRTLLVDRLGALPVTVNIATGRETRIHLPFESVNDAVISPDGTKIAFAAPAAGGIDSNAIWVAKADGTGLVRVTEMPALQRGPAWSPDERWIYFTSGKAGEAHDIWRVASSGEKREQITTGTLLHLEAAVSPTGELAYSSNRSGNYEIWIKRGDEEPVQVTHDPALDGEPAWSPDGRSILFTSTRSGVPNIWRIVPGSGPPVQITHTRQGARAAAWWYPAREHRP